VLSAADHLNRKAWAKAAGSLYIAAWRNDWLEDCCAHMTPVRKTWSENACLASAKKYVEIREWRKAERNAYDAAHSNGWLAKCTGHFLQIKKPNGYWTKERCVSDAKAYSYKKQWSRNNGAAYKRAKENGWLDECCAHMMEMKKEKGHWTFEKCFVSASEFLHRSEWFRREKKAYVAAHRNGWLEKCCAHMVSAAGGTDSDAAYMWCADGQTHNGKRVCKFGLSSARLKDERIRQVGWASGFVPTEVIIVERADAAALEKELLAFGEAVLYTGFGGCTEFRALTEDEIKLAKQKIICGAEKILLQFTHQISLSN
jgi:hypothetical protein